MADAVLPSLIKAVLHFGEVMVRIIVFAVALVTAINLPWMLKLGAEYDESLFWPATVRMIHGSPQRLANPMGAYVASRPLPFMTAAYIGAVNSYFYALPVFVFGSRTIAYRMTNVFFLLLFFLFTFRLGNQVQGKSVAWMTIALLGANEELWLQGITNQGPFSLQLISTSVFMSALLSYLDVPRKSLVVVMAASLALGLNEKLTYMWVIATIATACIVFFGKTIARRRLPFDVLLGAAVLGIGVLPILVYTIGNYHMSTGFARSQLALPADLIGMLVTRLRSVQLLFDGHWTMVHRVGPLDPMISTPFSFNSAVFTAGLVLAICRRNVLGLFFYSICISQVVINCFLPEGGRLHHLILMYPLPQLAASLQIEREVRDHLRLRRVIYGVFGLTLLVAMVNLWGFGQFAQARGGTGTWSSQITEISEWEQANPNLHLVYACWGLDHTIFALGEGRRQHLEFYFPLLPDTLTPDTQAQLDVLLRRRETVWIESSVDDIQNKVSANLRAAAGQRQLSPRVLKQFREQSTGKLIFSVISFHPSESTSPPRDVALRQLTPQSLAAPLGEGSDRVRLRLRFRDLSKSDTIFIEFQSGDGGVVQRHFRPLEYYALLDPLSVWVFGESLYPDWFLTDYPNSGKKASRVVVRLESANPLATVVQQ